MCTSCQKNLTGSYKCTPRFSDSFLTDQMSKLHCNVKNFEINVSIMSFRRVIEIWNWYWYWIFKLSSNFEIIMYIFVFYWIEKRMNFYWNHPTFYISWRCLKIHFTTILKSITTKIFNIQHHFQHSTPYSNDMIHT